jgi:hypothetical protein
MTHLLSGTLPPMQWGSLWRSVGPKNSSSWMRECGTIVTGTQGASGTGFARPVADNPVLTFNFPYCRFPNHGVQNGREIRFTTLRSELSDSLEFLRIRLDYLARQERFLGIARQARRHRHEQALIPPYPKLPPTGVDAGVPNCSN